MRICLVAQEYPPVTALGGIGSQTWNKAHALKRLGHDVEVLSSGHAGWWIIAGCGAIVAVLAVVTTSPRALATAARTAERLR